MKRWKPVNAIKHLTRGGRKHPSCWMCLCWTGARYAGLVVCGSENEFCRYRRVHLRVLLSRWWGLHNPPEVTP